MAAADTSGSDTSISLKKEAHVFDDDFEQLAPETLHHPSQSRVVEGIDQKGTTIHNPHAHLQHTTPINDQSIHPRKSVWGPANHDMDDGNDRDDLEQVLNRQVVVDIEPVGQGQNQSHMLVPLDRNRSASQPPAVHTVHADEAASPSSAPQGIPLELRNFTSEVLLVVVCSMSLTLYAFALGDVTVTQEEFKRVLGIKNAELPWLVGAYNTANGLSLVVSGSLMDLAPPKRIMVGAFAWFTLWNIIGVFSLHPKTAVLFYIVRAMQGVAVGVMVSGSLSILGRVYKPGIRKNRVFSAMSATAPFGFWLGGIQGGALRAHLRWIFGSNAIIGGLCCIIALHSVPSLRPAADIAGTEAPSLRQFDYLGAAVALAGFICLLFGLTQGSVTSWSPYTYSLVIVGFVLLLACFPLVERYVQRPLIPSRLWKTKGFKPLMASYFLGFGCYAGAWQFYAVQFWLRIQHADALKVALYLLPNAIVGVLATWIVSRTLHRIPGHYILTASMIAFSLGPVFFLPQTPNTIYWALSMPGVALVTFGPDLAFAAASIFITSNVARSYQGSAGSMLMMCQNLSNAVVTAAADAVGARVDKGPSGDIGLRGLKAIWWLGFAGSLVAALMTVVWVRIPKEEEKEHVT